MKNTPKELLCELHILKNRLDSGESLIQCLNTMGIPLRADKGFLTKWNKILSLMIEGKVSATRAVADFLCILEDTNRLQNLVAQKTLAARIQAYLSIGIVFLLIFSSKLLFPDILQPSFTILSISLGLALLSAILMKAILKYFLKELSFLDWIHFLRLVALSLQCGMTLPAALHVNMPPPATFAKWPKHFENILRLDFLENTDFTYDNQIKRATSLWKLAERTWMILCKNYSEGRPQVEIILKFSQMQEEEFKNRILIVSEKLSYLLLLPLFFLSVPAILILLFAPLLSALI